MDRLRRHALVAELIELMRMSNSWCGRTHIQKTLFAFQTLFEPEADLSAQYILYKHGPYSFELDEDLAEMEFYGAIDREEQLRYGPRYRARSGAQTLRERFGRGTEVWRPHLQFVAQRVSTKNVRELEALCTMMYVATTEVERSRYPGTEEQLLRVHELKPHLAEAEVEEAYDQYQQLRKDAQQLALTATARGSVARDRDNHE